MINLRSEVIILQNIILIVYELGSSRISYTYKFYYYQGQFY